MMNRLAIAAILAADLLTLPGTGVGSSDVIGVSEKAETERLVCEHIKHTMPTPAVVEIALINEHNTMFVCTGDESLGHLVYVMRDADELWRWRETAPDRLVIEGEEDGDN